MLGNLTGHANRLLRGFVLTLVVGGVGLCASLHPRMASALADETRPPATHVLLTAISPTQPRWLVSSPPGNGTTARPLYVLDKSGGFHPVRVDETGGRPHLSVASLPIPSDLITEVLPAQMADGTLLGAGRNGQFVLIQPSRRVWRFANPSVPLSPLSRPVPLSMDAIAAATGDGGLILFRRRKGRWNEAQRIGADSARTLPDAVLAAADLDGDGRSELIVPAAPTNRYPHGVLGDAIEPSELHVYRLKPAGLELLASYAAGDGAVFEGLGVLTADLDGDGRHEILVTRSDTTGGAAHLVLALQGKKLLVKARGAAIGEDRRWSHLLGAFDIDGSGLKLLAVETPHLAGYLLALHPHGGKLRERARRAGFTTHAAGSRNLWQFALFRRGGVIEVVMQETGGRRLAGLALFGKSWVVRWRLPLPEPMASNLLSGDFNGDGKDDIAYADRGGVVHVLLSRTP